MSHHYAWKMLVYTEYTEFIIKSLDIYDIIYQNINNHKNRERERTGREGDRRGERDTENK